MKDLSVPIYVTRPNHDDLVGTWSINVYVGLAVLLVVVLNIVGWGIFGLVSLLLMLL